MPSVKPAGKGKRKVALKVPPQKRTKRAPTDYDDEITKDTITKLNKVVSDDEFDGHDTISGPAW